jgi:hypothetical protein
MKMVAVVVLWEEKKNQSWKFSISRNRRRRDVPFSTVPPPFALYQKIWYRVSERFFSVSGRHVPTPPNSLAFGLLPFSNQVSAAELAFFNIATTKLRNVF